jgi:aspartate aminotransferase-like enzyme
MLPASLPSATLTRAVRERGYTIGSGYGKNRDTTIRIGHMGDHTLEGLEKCLRAVGLVLAELNGA